MEAPGGSTTGSTTASTTTTTIGETGCTSPCHPPDNECLGLVDNSGKTKFGLRVSDLRPTTPPTLVTGILATILTGAVPLTNPQCGIDGSGTFSWLLQFDLANGTLTTGGAKPTAAAAAGYSFFDGSIGGGTPISPAVLDLQLAPDGSFSTPSGAYLEMPIFLDAAGTQYLILPFHDLRISGTLSASHNCVGYAVNLPPPDMCWADGPVVLAPTGSIDALITLEDADTVPITSLNESLCVLLANNTGVPGPNGYKVCARDANGKIVFQGDGCTTGNGCGDALTYHAKFAAASIEIH